MVWTCLFPLVLHPLVSDVHSISIVYQSSEYVVLKYDMKIYHYPISCRRFEIQQTAYSCAENKSRRTLFFYIKLFTPGFFYHIQNIRKRHYPCIYPAELLRAWSWCRRTLWLNYWHKGTCIVTLTVGLHLQVICYFQTFMLSNWVH